MPSGHPNLSSPGDHLLELEHDGRRRTALVHVPPAALGTARLPLLLAMHGGGTDARTMADFCGLSEKADAAGFFVVYPDGTGRQDGLYTWNAGNCCGYALRYGVDDVAFIDRLLDRLDNELAIDRQRIFATGMSNGAMLAYRLADELSQRFAAIAPVAGPMGSAECHPRRPVSVIHFHGTGDDFAPYQGGKGLKSLSKAVFYSVDHSVAAWVAANGCPSQPAVETLTTASESAMPVTRRVYGPGRDNSEVILVTIEGGGHTWPGRVSKFNFLGPTTLDISANDLMWEFFLRHPL
jgi:polyhydroxybutyrate depolymerase